MAGFWEEVFEPGFGGDGDEGEVLRDREFLLGHPGDDGEGVAGAGGHDGGGWVF